MVSIQSLKTQGTFELLEPHISNMGDMGLLDVRYGSPGKISYPVFLSERKQEIPEEIPKR